MDLQHPKREKQNKNQRYHSIGPLFLNGNECQGGGVALWPAHTLCQPPQLRGPSLGQGPISGAVYHGACTVVNFSHIRDIFPNSQVTMVLKRLCV